MDNHSPAPGPSTTADEIRIHIAGRRAQARERPAGRLSWLRRLPLLWQMVLLALVGHVAFIALTSTGRLFGAGSGETLEQIYEQGEAAMERGDYLAAQEHFQRVLDAQPKPPPIFSKAADRHRLADRLAKQKKVPTGGADPAATKPAEAGEGAGDGPATRKAPAPEEMNAKPPARVREPSPEDEDFVPPELRLK